MPAERWAGKQGCLAGGGGGRSRRRRLRGREATGTVDSNHNLTRLGDAHAFASLVAHEFWVAAKTIKVAARLIARALDGSVSLLFLALTGAEGLEALGLITIS